LSIGAPCRLGGLPKVDDLTSASNPASSVPGGVLARWMPVEVPKVMPPAADRLRGGAARE